MFPDKNSFNLYDRAELRRICGFLLDEYNKQKTLHQKAREESAELKIKAHLLCEKQRELILKELLPNPAVIELYRTRSIIESLVLRKARTPRLQDIGNVPD